MSRKSEYAYSDLLQSKEYIAGKRDHVCSEMKRKGREKREKGRKGKREKWKKREGGMKEGKGNHRVHCWHVARLALLLRRVQQLLELGEVVEYSKVADSVHARTCPQKAG